ncbi:hypothetical protein JCM19274_649 [Algibacter lectus]|uniref:Uncharacterized protein n=1 Tax=Algibacter lectus TaxID=221126 RepID=A0A090WY53_9FLAO|nr:hypothetical protein JCM19274_649 [Algibacter lectus]
MAFKKVKIIQLVLAVCLVQTASIYAQNPESINIDTTTGHAIKMCKWLQCAYSR